MIPLVTIIGPQMAYLMVGTVWVENIFRIPGLGQLFANAAVTRDYPLLVTSTFILALTVMIMNLIVDVLYAILDPRIKLD
jgi:peptide/nickel transport system permease protein